MLEVSADNFEAEVAKSKLPVVIDFTASWCSPCQQLAPIFETLSKEFAGKMVFAKCDIDANQEFAQSNAVMSVPCLVIFKDDQEAGRIVGNQSEDLLRQQLKAFL